MSAAGRSGRSSMQGHDVPFPFSFLGVPFRFFPVLCLSRPFPLPWHSSSAARSRVGVAVRGETAIGDAVRGTKAVKTRREDAAEVEEEEEEEETKKKEVELPRSRRLNVPAMPKN